MSIESEFTKHQKIWDDCYLGYVFLPNSIGQTDQNAIKKCLSEVGSLNFYPWLNESETIIFPTGGLSQVSFNKFENLFLAMANEAIRHGSEYRLSESELKKLLTSFQEGLVDAKYFSNFTKSGWRPVTNHSRDSFLCAVGKHRIGMWLSCDDE